MAIDIIVAEVFLLTTSVISIIFGIVNIFGVYAIDM